MNPYLLIGLSMAVGAVFGYAACLWRWCSAEEARTKAEPAESPVETSIRITSEGRPLSSFYRPPTTFRHAHDCRAEGCTDEKGRSRH